MSTKEIEAEGMILRRGEWRLLEDARAGEVLPAEDAVRIIERLGRLRKAREDDPLYRQQADELRGELEALQHARAVDLRRFEQETRRIRRQRDDYRAAAADADARRMSIQRRAREA